MVLPLDQLSPADVAFVKAWTPPANAAPVVAPVAAKPKATPTGPVAGKLVIVPKNDGAKINPLGAGAFDIPTATYEMPTCKKCSMSTSP